jgi:biopolymer transport protein ExbD
MMRIKPARAARKPENTIVLINVVFLMLIFFLIAGTLAPAPDHEVSLVSLAEMDSAPPPDMAFMRKDGTLTWRGAAISDGDLVATWRTLQDEAAEIRPLRVAADRALPAVDLIDRLESLRKGGIGRIVLVTERLQP